MKGSVNSDHDRDVQLKDGHVKHIKIDQISNSIEMRVEETVTKQNKMLPKCDNSMS